eukprot:CAMPEP_0185796476 /NCGR_PEP_ID=MMETSP1174-20130828/161106_1 /TAXON_ID=35687 /ORGANISM="Dictyocha speculum, Strain CCMP1381" /LENGTH=83 /DNA_ID=CAMNT_0028491849 /DNA_START=1923 /DNA_END=2174 /DNA_ORIENTATION=-
MKNLPPDLVKAEVLAVVCSPYAPSVVARDVVTGVECASGEFSGENIGGPARGLTKGPFRVSGHFGAVSVQASVEEGAHRLGHG